MLTRRTVILTGIEATYGTDPALTAAVNGVLAWDVNIEPKGDILKREILRDTISPGPHVIGLKEVALTFKTEMKGAAAASTSPELNMISGCGFGTAALSGTANTYSLVSDESQMPSLSFWVYIDGNRHKVTGARGSAKLTLEAGKYGVWDWSFSGIYNAVDAATVPDISSYTTFKPPICYAANFQIGGYTPVCQKVEIDLGNTISRRDDLNATSGVQSFKITGREPKMTFTPDAVIESTNPFWGDWVGEIVDTYSFSIGSTAGNKIVVNGYFQYENNKYSDSDGIRTYECTASLVTSDMNTQNQEMTLKYA